MSQPFADVRNVDVIDALESGVRLPQVDGCSDGMYQFMLSCWAWDSAERPIFDELNGKLLELIALDDNGPESTAAIKLLNDASTAVQNLLHHEITEEQLRFKQLKSGDLDVR